VDAHSAMVMAQGFSRADVQSILADVDNTTLIDEKTRKLLQLAGKITRHAYKVTESDIQALRDTDCTDEEIFEAIAVASLFNYMDRMADALGAPVEGFQDMIEQMMQKYTVE
jgi:alkylhydroperoxidase family enzyme